jgi:hypothetical protein
MPPRGRSGRPARFCRPQRWVPPHNGCDSESRTDMWIPTPARCATRGGEQCVADEASGTLPAVGAMGTCAPCRSAPGYASRTYRTAAHLCYYPTGTAPSQQARPMPVLRLVTLAVAILAPTATMHCVPRSGIRSAPRLGRGVVAIARQHRQAMQPSGRAGMAETTRAELNHESAGAGTDYSASMSTRSAASWVASAAPMRW